MPVNFVGRRDSEDDKQIVAISPAPPGTFTWYTSAGDIQSPLQRGAGTKLIVEFLASETIPADPGYLDKSIEAQFAEPVYLHDGEINWRDPDQFSAHDTFDVGIVFPATTGVTENPTQTGNCTLYEVYPGMNYIIPADGDGTHDVDLATAVPLPTSTGYWHVDKKTGDVAAGAADPDDGYQLTCALADFSAPTIYLIKTYCMTSVRGLFEVDAYLVEWISERWKLSLKVRKEKQMTADCEVSGMVMLFRYGATES